MRSFIRDNAGMWLRDYHVDGLRFDMTPYMRSVDADADFDLPDGWSLQSWVNRAVRQEFPDAITIAEDLHGEPLVTSTAPEGAAYHAQWEAKFVHPVREAIIDTQSPRVACVGGSHRCNASAPEVCSATRRWHRAGDAPCAAVGGACVTDGGVAYCAPADGGAR